MRARGNRSVHPASPPALGALPRSYEEESGLETLVATEAGAEIPEFEGGQLYRGLRNGAFERMFWVVATFNELPCAHGIEPTQVALLRHSGTGPLGLTPHDLWRRGDGSFDRYQCTQAPGKPLFELPYWASFVSNPANETLFIGLYGATKGAQSEIDWLCPMTGVPPGEDNGRPSDLYHLVPLEALSDYRGSLKIEWDNGWIAWARYASRSDHALLGDVDTAPIARFEASLEGEKTWRRQRDVERDPKLGRKALAKNADDHNGKYVCEACNFNHDNRAMFDAHHPHPLLTGPRMTRMSDLVVLCPVCHRRAHRGANRMLPYDLEELRAWNGAGRP